MNNSFEGDLRKNTNSNAKKISDQSKSTPLDVAANFIGDLTVNYQKNKEVAQAQNYLAEHGGQMPLGTLVRYVGDNPNVSSQEWAKAAQDTYNFNKYGAGSGITFDNSTGKVTIKATKAIKESDWYKEKFKENGTFIQVAKLYGADPSGNTGIKMQDKDGNIEEIKVKDWLEREAKAFDDYVKDYATVIKPTKDWIEEASEGRIKWSDNDAITSLGVLNKEKHRYKNDTVLRLPDVALRWGLNKLPSFNAEYKTISAKDFYDWYQVNVGGDKYAKNAGEKMNDLEELEIALASSISRILNDEDPSEIDNNNLARSLAMLKTITNDKPDTDGFVKTALFAKSFTASLQNTLVDASVNLTSFLEYATTKVADIASINNTSGKVLAVATAGGSVALSALESASVVSTEAAKAGAYNLGEFIAGVDANQSEQVSANAFYAIGDIYNSLLEGNGKEAITKWANATNTPLNYEALAAVDEFYQEGQASREDITGWAVGGRVVGGFVGEIIKQIALTNVVGGIVGKAVSSGIASIASDATAEALTSLSNSVVTMESGLQVYVGAQRTSQLCLSFVKATELLSKSAGWGGNILAQAMVDTVLNDEELVEKMIENPNEEERHAFYEAYSYNAKQNLFGEMTGIGFQSAGKGLALALRKTGLSAGATRIMARLGAKKHTALAVFSDWMADGNSKAARMLDKVFKASDSTSKWWSNLHWTEAKALYEIADSAKGAKSIAEATEATQKAVINRMEVEIALNNVTRGTMKMWKRIISNDAIATQYKSVNDAYSDLLASEGKNARTIGEVKSVSQETSDYIALVSRSDQLAAKQLQLEGEGKSLSKDEAAFKEGIDKRIKDYEGSHSAEHVQLAKNYLNKFRAYEYAYMQLATKSLDEGGFGLYDEETVMGWRSTGFWGKDGEQYIPLVAIKTSDDVVATASKFVDDSADFGNYKAKLSIDEYELKPGDIDAHYLDPQMTIYAQQVTAAKVYNAREWGNVLIANDVKAQEIDVEGRPVTKPEIRSSRSKIRGIAEKTIAAYKKEGDILNYSLRENYKAQTGTALKKAKAGFKKSVGALDYNDIKALSKAGVEVPVVPNPRTKAQLDMFMESLTKEEKNIVTESLNGETLTIKHFNTARAHTDMAVRLQRSMLARKPEIIGSDAYLKYVDTITAAGEEADNAIALLGSYTKLSRTEAQNALKAIGLDDFNTASKTVLDHLLTSSDALLQDNKFLNQMLDRYAELGVSKDVAKKYLILQEYKSLFSGKTGSAKLNEVLRNNLENLEVAGNISTATKTKIVSEFDTNFKSHLDSEWAKAASDLETAGGKELLDTESVYNYIYDQMSDFIDTTLKNPNVVQVLDGNGKFHLYQLSPTTATLYMTRPDFSGGKKGIWGFFNKTNRLARLNNVGWSIKSFMNQWIKDPLDAFVLGGFSHSIRTNADEIGELLSPSVVDRVINEIGEEGWGKIVAEAKESAGRSLTADELVSLARKQAPTAEDVKSLAAEVAGDEGAEARYYREMGGGYRNEMWGKFKEEQSLMERALSWAEQHSLGSRREVYLRKGVFMNAYRDALAMGHTTKEAATIAEFTAQNATTNFSRQFSFGNNIVGSVPFLGAALNGRASFWRLMEIDPVGISTRFTTGLVLPMISLVTQSLQSESDKEVYKTFAEYEKESAICFVVDGEKFKIPMPEELSKFLSPFRHIVEKSNDANDHSWTELTASDLLQVSPIDLTGFVGLDENTLEGDPAFTDRLGWEASALISQLSPQIVKTAYMAITGIDPYTGERINKEQVWTDEDGDSQIIDSKSNAFLTWLASKLKEMGVEVSGSSLHALFKTLVGNAGTDIFDSIIDLFSGQPVEAVTRFTDQFYKPFESSTSKDPGSYKLREAIKILEREKDALLNGGTTEGKKFQNIANQISMLDPADPKYDEKLQKLNRERKQIIQDYQQKVFNVMKNYQDQYGGTYDRYAFASTINLLTFYRNYSSGIQTEDKLRNTEKYYAERNEAIRTMVAYGFDSPSDMSIFGYLRTNEFGDVEEKTYSPTEIMSMSSEVWGQTSADMANIKVALEKAEITRKNMFGDEYEAAKAAGKAALKKYKSDWNKKVIEALAPYIESRGVDNVISSYDTQDLMDNFLFDVNQYNRKKYLLKIFGE